MSRRHSWHVDVNEEELKVFLEHKKIITIPDRIREHYVLQPANIARSSSSNPNNLPI